MSYIVPSIPNPLVEQSQSIPIEAVRTFDWMSFDSGQGGTVRFITTAEVTGERVPYSAFYRMLCIDLLSRMDEESLKLASEWLAETLGWQNRERLISKEHIPTNFLPVSGVDRIERKPFELYD